MALAALAAADGVGDLAEIRDWNVYAPRKFLAFFGFLAAVAASALLIFILDLG